MGLLLSSALMAALGTTGVALRQGGLARSQRRAVLEAVAALEQEVLLTASSTEPRVLAGERSWGEELAARWHGHTRRLEGLPDDARGAVRVEVVTDETRSDVELGIELGLPRDLDGDGAALSRDVRARARLLPVIVRCSWSGAAGRREARQAFFVVEG